MKINGISATDIAGLAMESDAFFYELMAQLLKGTAKKNRLTIPVASDVLAVKFKEVAKMIEIERLKNDK